jgi:hypothetical protein
MRKAPWAGIWGKVGRDHMNTMDNYHQIFQRAADLTTLGNSSHYSIDLNTGLAEPKNGGARTNPIMAYSIIAQNPSNASKY